MDDAIIVPCPHCDTPNRVPLARRAETGKCGRCKGALFTGKPIALDAARFDKHAGGDLPLLVDFWASWCGPCRAMAPVFEAAAASAEPALRLAKVDTDAAPEIAGRYQIRAIPTLILFHKGREVARHSGAMMGGQLRQWIAQHAPGSSGAKARA